MAASFKLIIVAVIASLAAAVAFPSEALKSSHVDGLTNSAPSIDGSKAEPLAKTRGAKDGKDLEGSESAYYGGYYGGYGGYGGYGYGFGYPYYSGYYGSGYYGYGYPYGYGYGYGWPSYYGGWW